MKTLSTFGIPVTVDEQTKEFHFPEDVQVEKSSSKPACRMAGLLYDETGIAGRNEINYTFYNNVIRRKDLPLFKDRNYSNGITVLMPGLINGECRKNSGHYHEVMPGHVLPYPEAYEILCGSAVFLFQVSKNFHAYAGGLGVDDVIAVFMEAGDKVIAPPYCAHICINVGEDICAFGNLAAACDLNYEPIKAMHGLCYYVLKENGRIVFVPNARYHDIPLVRVREAKEFPRLGIVRGRSLYEQFTEDPSKFDYLSQPEKYEREIAETLL